MYTTSTAMVAMVYASVALTINLANQRGPKWTKIVLLWHIVASAPRESTAPFFLLQSHFWFVVVCFVRVAGFTDFVLPATTTSGYLNKVIWNFLCRCCCWPFRGADVIHIASHSTITQIGALHTNTQVQTVQASHAITYPNDTCITRFVKTDVQVCDSTEFVIRPGQTVNVFADMARCAVVVDVQPVFMVLLSLCLAFPTQSPEVVMHVEFFLRLSIHSSKYWC